MPPQAPGVQQLRLTSLDADAVQALPQAEFVEQFGQPAWDAAPVVLKEVVTAKALTPIFRGLDGQQGEEPWRVNRETAQSFYGLSLAAAPRPYYACLGLLCLLAEYRFQGFVPDGKRLVEAAKNKNMKDLRKLLLVGSDVNFKARARRGGVAGVPGGDHMV